MMNNATAMTPKMFTFAKATSEMDSLAANAGAANAVVAAATDLDNCSAFWETTCCAFCGKDACCCFQKRREKKKMLVSQLNFKTLKIEVFQKKDTIFPPLLSLVGKDFSLSNPPRPREPALSLSLSLSSLQTSHHRFQQNEDDGDDDDNNVLIIIIITVLKSKQPQNTTPKVLSLSLSLLSREREQKAQKNKAKNRATKSKNQKKTERERSIFFQLMEEEILYLSLSLSLLLLLLPPREISERRENDRFSSHGEASLSLSRRARALGGFKKKYAIDQKLSSPSPFLPQERERESNSFLLVSGEREHFLERETQKKKNKISALSILLP